MGWWTALTDADWQTWSGDDWDALTDEERGTFVEEVMFVQEVFQEGWAAFEALHRTMDRRGVEWVLQASASLKQLSLLLPQAIQERDLDRLFLLYGQLETEEERAQLRGQLSAVNTEILATWPTRGGRIRVGQRDWGELEWGDEDITLYIDLKERVARFEPPSHGAFTPELTLQAWTSSAAIADFLQEHLFFLEGMARVADDHARAQRILDCWKGELWDMPRLPHEPCATRDEEIAEFDSWIQCHVNEGFDPDTALKAYFRGLGKPLTFERRMAVESWLGDMMERIQADYDAPKNEFGDPL